MILTRKLFTAIAFLFLATPRAYSATPIPFPTHLFAPYMYIGEGDNFQFTDCLAATGLKHYTLAFIIAREDRQPNPANPDKPRITYLPEPAWDARLPIAPATYGNQIDALRQHGGDVIISFGGESGRELATVITNPTALQAAYQKVIDTYHVTWLDFDIEGNTLDRNQPATVRRNTALAALQKQNPGLVLSFTLPANPDGLSKRSLALITDALHQGVHLHSVTLMTMYFGKDFIHKGKSEAELSIQSATTAHTQLQKIAPTISLGLCPCLGENGSPQEIFTPQDATTLKTFADHTPWISSLHFWSINRDANPALTTSEKAPSLPAPWSFTHLFLPFTTPSSL